MGKLYKLMNDEDKCVFVGSYPACESRMDYGDYITEATEEVTEQYYDI